MELLHFEGTAEELYRDLPDLLEDKLTMLNFPYDDEGASHIHGVQLRLYYSSHKCTLDEAMEGFVKELYGLATFTGEAYGYSEYTIEGFYIHSMRMGGHDIREIIKSLDGQYVHFVMEF